MISRRLVNKLFLSCALSTGLAIGAVKFALAQDTAEDPRLRHSKITEEINNHIQELEIQLRKAGLQPDPDELQKLRVSLRENYEQLFLARNIELYDP